MKAKQFLHTLLLVFFVFESMAQQSIIDQNFGNSGIVKTHIFDFNDDNVRTAHSSGVINDILIHNQKIIAVGHSHNNITESDDLLLISYNLDGTIDDSFGEQGFVFTSIEHGSIQGHRIVRGAPFNRFIVMANINLLDGSGVALVCYNEDGSLDNYMDDSGIKPVYIAPYIREELIVVGTDMIADWYNGGYFIIGNKYQEDHISEDSDFFILKVSERGEGDLIFISDFNDNIKMAANSVVRDYGRFYDREDCLFVGGYWTENFNDYENNNFLLMKFDLSGNFVEEFGDREVSEFLFGKLGGVAYDRAFPLSRSEWICDLEIQPDGKILVSGKHNKNYEILMKFTEDGILDEEFGYGGITDVFEYSNELYSSSSLQNILIVNDDEFFTTASSYYAELQHDFGITNYWPDGIIIEPAESVGFERTDIGSTYDYVNTAKPLEDGKIVLAGSFRDEYGQDQPAMAKYIIRDNDPPLITIHNQIVLEEVGQYIYNEIICTDPDGDNFVVEASVGELVPKTDKNWVWRYIVPVTVVEDFNVVVEVDDGYGGISLAEFTVDVFERTYIPDANFEQTLIDQGIDRDQTVNQQISQEDAETVTSLYVYTANISDLTGIEGFINLINLDCSDNQLTSLDLSENTMLRSLDCHGNNIKTLNLTNLKDLIQIYCYYNEIYTLDISQMPNLERLYCYSNNLGAEDPVDPNTPQLLDVSNNLELQELMCHNNELWSLDVSNNTQLTRLECFANNLEELDLTYNPLIYWIRCGVNPLTELDLSNQTVLTKVECDGTDLVHIDMRNGNNHNLVQFVATRNPNLSCISVDDELGDHSIWQVGPHPELIFSNDCGYNTQQGDEVVVILLDDQIDYVKTSFEKVISSGQTTVEVTIENDVSLPAGYKTLEPSKVFYIETTAIVEGEIEVELSYADLAYDDEEAIQMLHYDIETRKFQNISNALKMQNDIVTGVVKNAKLSPFYIVEDALPPVIVNISYPVDPISLGTQADVNVTFEDNNLELAYILWGDGSDQDLGVITGASISWNHIYSIPGAYEAIVQLSDQTGNIVEESIRYIVVYDPKGGFVTGGGWIYSPPEAYIHDPTLEGKANFGFVSKYKKGSTVPTGNTEFQFKAADLNFNSDEYEWLVIAGPQAKFKGVGQMNNSGNYGFMVSAVDGQVPGGGDLDKFRIKIWDISNNDLVVYDNQIGEDEDAPPTTIIDGGSIKIHDGKDKNARIADVGGNPELDLNQQIHIYPNPVREIVTIEFPSGYSAINESNELHLFNLAGVDLMENHLRVVKDNRLELDLMELPSGIYILSLPFEDRNIQHKITKL